MPPVVPQTSVLRADHFHAQTIETVSQLRQGLLSLMTAAGADPALPQDVARRFKLDKTLMWKIGRVIRSDSLAAAASHVPGRRRMASLVNAMRKHGAPASAAHAVWEAFHSFENVVQKHSGDRSMLDVMVAEPTNQQSNKRLELLRKSGFLSNAAVWGVRARMQFGMHVIAPTNEPGMLDAITMCGFVELQRLRSHVPWAVANATSLDPNWADSSGPTPLRPEGLVHGGPLLPEFCSQPTPLIRTVTASNGNRRYEIVEGPVGRSAAVNVVLGWRWPRDLSVFEKEADEFGEHAISASTPVELLSLDLWIHQDLAFAMNPTAAVFGSLPSGPAGAPLDRTSALLPLPTDVADLGAGAAGATMVEFPTCSDLLRYGMDRMAWNPDEFRGFRYRLKFPPIPIHVTLRHPLLKR